MAVSTVLTLVVGTLLTLTPTAAAHHNGPNGRVYDSMYPTDSTWWACTSGADAYCRTDNYLLTYYAEASLSSTARSNIANVLNNQFDPTDLAVRWENPPVYSGSAETDIIFQRTDLPGTLPGRAWCNDAISSQLCDQHYVQFDSDAAGSSPGIACHEIGHGVGLTHGEHAAAPTYNNDAELRCMVTPYNSNYTTLGVHNVDQINRTW